MLIVDNVKKVKKKCAKSNQKGSSSHALFRRCGILSIEAALVIPIFLILMINILSLICIIRNDLKIRENLYEEAKRLSIECSKGDVDDIGIIQQRILSSIGDEVVDSIYVDNANGGIDFSLSDLSDREIKRIIITYNAKLPYDLFGIFRFSFTEKAVVHTWIGYINGLNGDTYDEDIVYITENSEVYHKSKECTHLRLNIKKVSMESIETIRNSNGEKYSVCGYCKRKPKSQEVYITSDGNKYHKTLECSGLKRNFVAVRLSTVLDKRPCQRCGY